MRILMWSALFNGVIFVNSVAGMQSVETASRNGEP